MEWAEVGRTTGNPYDFSERVRLHLQKYQSDTFWIKNSVVTEIVFYSMAVVIRHCLNIDYENHLLILDRLHSMHVYWLYRHDSVVRYGLENGGAAREG
jgi:hypothetical protein